ncbi:related to decapping enzyme [Ceraceosorus bombacis]|uniref:Related to decapping enzyme n=1 Tax=Ceraceosorus bombacis TaxID=401625 RepID=A0A0P1BFE0_9BASI|nr:related to decapping enzyme [Ceraceosorus bombacis]
MPPRPTENVWKYPRPPALQRTSARLRVIWRPPTGPSAATTGGGEEVVLADTTQGWRVLETSHPPTYYFPPSSVRRDLLQDSSARRTMCEWKGQAKYHDVFSSTARIWSYPSATGKTGPTSDSQGFESIKEHYCFYASSNTDPKTQGAWVCMVDDDIVQAQEGDFYGSWITPEITGGERGFKGAAGTWGW